MKTRSGARAAKTRPVRPNLGLGVAYRKRITRLVYEMAASVEHWLRAEYRASPPRMAMDTPAADLKKAIGKLADRWERKFDDAAPELAKWFLKSVNTRSYTVLRKILKEAGITVRFQMTPAMRDVIDASVAENVSLIRTIPKQYLAQVETVVMESVQRGRDIGYLTRELLKRYDITAKRAALIARDQNNKATSALMAARQKEAGIEFGIWMHSHAGKEPRPTHLANDGKKFSIADGWFDPDKRVRKRIWPGELINCRCTWRPVVKGFS